MKGKPSIDDFLSGSTADTAEKPKETTKVVAPAAPTKVYREQKLYRLPTTITEALRDRAYTESKQTGRRVTETELVEQALSQFLRL